jgi:hypothetical protein
MANIVHNWIQSRQINEYGVYMVKDFKDHPKTIMLCGIHDFKLYRGPALDEDKALKLNSMDEKLKLLNNTVANVMSHTLVQLHDVKSSVLTYQLNFENNNQMVASALSFYQLKADEVNSRQDKVVATLLNQQEQISELKSFMYHMEMNNQE